MGNYSDYLRQKEEERKNQVAEYEQFVPNVPDWKGLQRESENRLVKSNRRQKVLQRKKVQERGGPLAHQKSMGSRKNVVDVAKSLEHRIAALAM